MNQTFTYLGVDNFVIDSVMCGSRIYDGSSHGFSSEPWLYEESENARRRNFQARNCAEVYEYFPEHGRSVATILRAPNIPTVATGELCVEVAPPAAISQETGQEQENPEHSKEEEEAVTLALARFS